MLLLPRDSHYHDPTNVQAFDIDSIFTSWKKQGRPTSDLYRSDSGIIIRVTVLQEEKRQFVWFLRVEEINIMDGAIISKEIPSQNPPPVEFVAGQAGLGLVG